ncbi:MAG: phage tail protein [Bacteroidia bacterium]|nr:phage tail protein [Bacteroidia bacterium]
MPADGSYQNNLWPLPTIYFLLRIEEEEIPFREVSGLNDENQVITYKHGNSKEFFPMKMLGMQKYSPITLKKAVFPKSNQLWAWYKEIQLNTIKPKTLSIGLLDESGKPTMTWTLINAWPAKMILSDLKLVENEVAIESLELYHEGIVIENS